MKIAIVNDVRMAVEALRRSLAFSPEHQIIWTASNGAEAVALCAQQTPDLILMDLMMPGMDGVEATRQIMAKSPCAIVVVTASIGANSWRVFEAMGHGALDAVDTPEFGDADGRAGAEMLLRKVETIGKLIGDRRPRPLASRPAGKVSGDALIAIGASSGGPTALAKLLGGLSSDLAAGVVIVQHIDEQFAAGMAEWLCQYSPWPVRLAREDDEPAPGTVLLAGTNQHLVLKSANRLGYTGEPAELVHRPSVDVFFNSVDQRWQGDVFAALLTGMGSDGAAGLKALRARGHYTVTQDAASSAVYGMPKAAAQLKAAVDILPLDAIAPRLLELVRGKHWNAK